MPAAKKTEDAMLTKNMRFYAKVMDVPKEATKPFDNGRFKGTDINPMWRLQMLTELFGPAGFGWWTQAVKYEFTNSPETKEVSVFCELELVVKDPETGEISMPIYGIGGNTYISVGKFGPRASDEAKKMAYTDALSIACKSLGFGHSIWYQNDRTKYTIDDRSTPVPVPVRKAEPEDVPKTEPEMKEENKPAPVEQPQDHTPETLAVCTEIDGLLKKIGASMNREEKKKFAEEVIAPITGAANYKKCTDINKLIALRNKLSA